MNHNPSNRPTRRILHTSDLHLAFPDDNACQSLQGVVNLAIKSRVDILLVAGDLFDHNRVEDSLLEFVKEQFRRLPIPVVVLPGNHDCLVPGGVFSKSGFWQDCRNIHVFRETQGETLDLPHLNVSIWGKPIDTYMGDVHPLEDIPAAGNDDAWNIAMAHGYFVDTESPIHPSYHITEAEIEKADRDYIALGHVPVFRCVCDNPVAYYAGSPSMFGTAALVTLSEKTGVQVTRCTL
jgi:DNA repair exonuclease SbcCD nuclease subunit